MAKGKKTGGRAKGVPNKRPAALAKAIEASGITPLAYMLGMMRQAIPAEADMTTQALMRSQRFEAAKAAAPYVHPRLASTELSGPGGKDIPIAIRVVFGAGN